MHQHNQLLDMGMFRSQPEGSISDSVSAEVFKISPKHDHRQWLLLPYGCKQAVAGRHGGTGANRLLHSTYCTGKYEIPWSWEFKMVDPAKKKYILSTNVAAKSRNLYTLFPFAWFCFDASALRLLDSKRYPEFSLETGWMPGRTQLLDWNGDGKTDRCGGVGFSEASSMTTFRRSERLGWRLPCTSLCDKIPLPLFLHEIAFLLKQLTISDSNS